MSESVYEEKTKFEEVLDSDDVSSISNKQSVIHFDPTPIASSKKRRGKGLLWKDFISVETGDFVTYSSLDDVKKAQKCAHLRMDELFEGDSPLLERDTLLFDLRKG